MRGALILLALLLSGCAASQTGPAPVPRARSAVEAALAKHIAILASDDYAGRQPGTEGEVKTLAYLSREWRAAGLESGTNDPANPWLAPVELSLSVPDRSSIRFLQAGRAVALPKDGVTVYAIGTRGLIDRAPVVFVGGSGETLEGAELAGRVAIMTWDHAGQSEQRAALLRAGAAAVLAVVEDDRELAFLTGFRRRGSYALAGADDAGMVDGYLSRAAFAALAGGKAADLLAAARDPVFAPVPLGLTASIEATSTPSSVRTYNLIGRLPGKRTGAGAVLLLAHWDHFGRCHAPGGADEVCNGAVDNASGLAMLTELAKRLAAGPKMDRDVYFLATTAEEWGLLGAQAFAENPPLPLDSIVAAFNLDTVAVAPAGGPVAIIGKGLTALDPGIAQVLAQTGRKEGDERLAQGFVRRQDGWALLQRDVPVVSVTSAFANPGALERYTAGRYHLPTDDAAGIELGGAAEDLALHVALVRFFADPDKWAATAGKSVNAP